MKNRKDAPGGFAGIPRVVMKSQDYKKLDGGAIKLLLELARQYTGKNNGDLTLAMSVLRNQGFSSTDTIGRAKDKLLRAGMIIQTRTGVFTNPGGRCALFALTWAAIDECEGKQLEVAPTKTPVRKFSLEQNRTPIPETGKESNQKQVRRRLRDSKGRYSSNLKQVRLMAIT